MKMMEIKAKAQEIGIQAKKMRKEDLVRAIQEREGNAACFKPGRTGCNHHECCWREDCLTN